MAKSKTTLVEKSPTFIRKSHELEQLFNKANRTTDEAFETLVSIMNSTKDEKLRADMATRILKLTMELSDMRNKDALQRMIMQIKLGQKDLVPIENHNGPEVNFDEILQLD